MLTDDHKKSRPEDLHDERRARFGNSPSP